MNHSAGDFIPPDIEIGSEDSNDSLNNKDDDLNEDEFERIDPDGEKIKLRRTRIEHQIRYTDPITSQAIYSFANINFAQGD